MRPLLIVALIASTVVPASVLLWGGRHHAHAVDGDTIVMDGRSIRLAGIDAPELHQSCLDADGKLYPCGRIAKDLLEALMHGRPVDCHEYGRSYNRAVAICTVDGTDLGGQMVWFGHAIDYFRYSGGRYAAQQEDARLARRGLWAGTFMEPEQFRRQEERR